MLTVACLTAIVGFTLRGSGSDAPPVATPVNGADAEQSPGAKTPAASSDVASASKDTPPAPQAVDEPSQGSTPAPPISPAATATLAQEVVPPNPAPAAPSAELPGSTAPAALTPAQLPEAKPVGKASRRRDGASIAKPASVETSSPTGVSEKSSSGGLVEKRLAASPVLTAELGRRRGLALHPRQARQGDRTSTAAGAARFDSGVLRPDGAHHRRPVWREESPVQPEPAPEADRWTVQLAAPKSETEARSDLKRLGAQHASALKGSKIAVHKAVVHGDTVYRVRVVDLSRADASALCTRLKDDGGACFVAR